MSVITIESKAFKILTDKLDLIHETVKVLALNGGHDKWVNETRAMLITDLSKRSLKAKRDAGIFTYSTATGRKIKYLRKELEDYRDKNASKKIKD